MATRKQYSPKFKAKLAMEAIRGERPLSQLASQYHVHPVQISQWRKTAVEQMPDLFVDGRKNKRAGEDVEKDTGRWCCARYTMQAILQRQAHPQRLFLEAGEPSLFRVKVGKTLGHSKSTRA